jgi:hypothetical protein
MRTKAEAQLAAHDMVEALRSALQSARTIAAEPRRIDQQLDVLKELGATIDEIAAAQE